MLQPRSPPQQQCAMSQTITRATSSLRVVLATVAVFAGSVAISGRASATPPAGAADPTRGTSGETDASLVLQIAKLTDQVQTAEERIAVDQVHQAIDSLALHQAEQILRTDAVDAFITGGQPSIPVLSNPSPVSRYYTDLAVQDQREVVSALHLAGAKASRDERTDQTDYHLLTALSGQLDQERASLEARTSLDAQLAVQQQADAARAAAMQAQQQERQQALDAAANSGSVAPVGTAVAATQGQQGLMSQYPFGPLSTAQLAGYGLAETGQTVSGVASWYGPGFDGRSTASGAIYDENGWTCASPDLPFGTLLLVTAGASGVLVEVNDRGPYVAGRVLDLSHAAAQALGSTGLISVVAYVVAPS